MDEKRGRCSKYLSSQRREQIPDTCIAIVSGSLANIDHVQSHSIMTRGPGIGGARDQESSLWRKPWGHYVLVCSTVVPTIWSEGCSNQILCISYRVRNWDRQILLETVPPHAVTANFGGLPKEYPSSMEDEVMKGADRS